MDTIDPSAAARALQALRRNHRGKPKVLRPCPRCGKVLGARQQRAHKCRQKGKPHG